MLALMGGVGAAVVIGGCGDGGSSSATGTTRRNRRVGRTGDHHDRRPGADDHDGRRDCGERRRPDPARDGWSLPGRRVERPERAGAERRRARRHPLELRELLDRRRPGVPLTIDLTLVDVDGGGVPLEGAAVYLWHCDSDGGYSMYSQGAADENYLRGVQAADADGTVTFISIFPAAYSGRWPHIHFQVYRDVAAATGGGTKLVTSQLALPEDVCDAVFATDGYGASVSNLSRTSLDTDNVFSDGHDLQLASVTGSPSSGYTASLTVGV